MTLSGILDWRVWVAIAIGTIVALIIFGMLKLRHLRLPAWPPHDWRAWAALASGIAGGAVLTCVAAWMIHIIAFSGEWGSGTERQRLAILGKALYMVLAGVIAVLLSQGLAINRRKISISPKDGIMIEGGGGPAAAAIDKATKAAATQQGEE